jgi:transposase
MPTQRRFPAFDAVLYSRRNRVERFFSKIKHFRAVATRYDKRNDTFLASIQLGALRIWLRTCEPVT